MDDDDEIRTPSLDQIVPLIDLPEGAIATTGVTIVSYLLPDGNGGYAVRFHGDSHEIEMLGLLMKVAIDVATQQAREQ